MRPVIILRTHEQIDRACRYLKAIKPDETNPQAVYVGPYKKIRTLEANAAYWSRIGLIADATGHDMDVLHEFFKRRVFGVQVAEIGGQMVEVTAASSKATRADFSRLIDCVNEFIAEHGIEESA